METIKTQNPTLNSVFMVEQTIQQHSGELGKYQLWKALPRKMMYLPSSARTARTETARTLRARSRSRSFELSE